MEEYHVPRAIIFAPPPAAGCAASLIALAAGAPAFAQDPAGAPRGDEEAR